MVGIWLGFGPDGWFGRLLNWPLHEPKALNFLLSAIVLAIIAWAIGVSSGITELSGGWIAILIALSLTGQFALFALILRGIVWIRGNEPIVLPTEFKIGLIALAILLFVRVQSF